MQRQPKVIFNLWRLLEMHRITVGGSFKAVTTVADLRAFSQSQHVKQQSLFLKLLSLEFYESFLLSCNNEVP